MGDTCKASVDNDSPIREGINSSRLLKLKVGRERERQRENRIKANKKKKLIEYADLTLEPVLRTFTGKLLS